MAIYKAKAWQDVLKANSPALLSMSFEINTVFSWGRDDSSIFLGIAFLI